MTRSWGYPPQKRPDPGRYEPLAVWGYCAPRGRPPRVAEIVNGNSAMRETEARFWMLQTSSLTRALRFAAIALGVGLVMAAGPVRAADDEDEDDKTFEEKIIEGIMRGIGGTNMENRGIEYRERSPLVVPPKLDLPPPGSVAAEAKAPNWPKDPDEQRRKAAIAARKKANKDPREASRILMPSELAQKGSGKASGDNIVDQPGGNINSAPL